ncbi:MAG: hypothetical protein ISP83_00145 [Candidatus Poseidonia sp.]|nr:hypothetical protein [Poseidonia sp.]MBL6748654.1 hypothetical protein [Poseidonia sp.]MBL6805897.1 hypothetical protein [Poseidonia sp.]MBL6887103.1 hypothetical protein [Poseidonia sp.]MBL6891977.1 hypothetical protein [Poseidonia sp.]
MGRSVPPWRTRADAELNALMPFHRALPSNERLLLDQLVNDVRQRRSAGGMLPAHNTWQPVVLSMLIGVMKRLEDLSNRIAALEEMTNDD